MEHGPYFKVLAIQDSSQTLTIYKNTNFVSKLSSLKPSGSKLRKRQKSETGDLVYKFRKIIGKHDFPYHFKKIIVRDKKIGYNIDVWQQTACLVANPIKGNGFAYLFNCTTVGRASD